MTQTKAELLQTRHQGDIRLGDADSTHYVGFKAPTTVTSSLVWTLPAADGTANYLLKTDGSGNLGWVADSSTDSTKMPLAGGTFTGNVIYNDNVEARFGTGADLKIYHDGTDNYWQTSATTHFRINNGNRLTLDGTTGDVSMQGSSGRNFKWDNSAAYLNLNDNAKATYGTADDLSIYHNGTNSIINNNTGDLYIQTDNNFKLEAKDGGNDMIHAVPTAQVELHFNGVKKYQTSAAGSRFIGGIAQDVTAVSALELDLNTSNYFTKTISGNSTFTFANPAASGQVTAFTLELTHSSGTVTWPSSVKWNADTAPTLTTGKTHLFMFVTDDGGSRYRGSALVDYVN